MAKEPKPPLLVFPGEADRHEELFEQTPLTIVKMYLEGFDSEGRHVFEVPQHVLEALARRFRSLMEGEHNSLDDAFGGRVAVQRNELIAQGRDWTVLWKLLRELEVVRGQTPSERGAGTPFEIAVERVAEKLGMSPDNVRRIYKQNGPKGRRRRSKASG